MEWPEDGPAAVSPEEASGTPCPRRSKGVLQGYDGVALADSKRQGIGHAAAFGEGQEPGRLRPLRERGRATCQALELSEAMRTEAKLPADAGYARESNAADLCAQGIDASSTAPLLRQRYGRREERCM